MGRGFETTWVARGAAVAALAAGGAVAASLGAGVPALAAVGLAAVALGAAAVAGARRARAERETEQRSLRQQLDHLWASGSDLVLVAERGGRLADVNPRAVEALGYARDELVGRDLRELAPPELREELERQLREAVDRGSVRFEAVYRRKDGSCFPVEVAARAVEAGERRLALAVARDLGERRQLERLARMEASLLRHLGDAVVAADRELRVSAWTGAAERIYRRSAVEVLGRPLCEAFGAAADAAADAERRARVEAGEVLRFDDAHRGGDGRAIAAAVTWAALRDDAGGVVGHLLVSRDVTEQQRLQAQLVFADRLASIGTLAAGVAHEINNPLSYLLANFEFLEERMRAAPPDAEALVAVREARDGARRIAEIVRGLRTFSRRDAGALAAAPVDLREPVRAAARIAEGQLRSRASLVLDLQEVPPVRGSEHELAQVALNLLVNAAHAIPDGSPAEHDVRVSTRRAVDGRVALEVADDGAGIAPEHLPRIFDPFFTTRRVGEGSGLGLAICHGIVETLGGAIEVESELGRGSRFRVLLPAAPVTAARPAEARTAGARRGRVLVVDDEPFVCGAVARTLSREHDVVTLTDPVDALCRLDGGEHFDLVVCDLMMPGVSGMKLHERLGASRPELASGMVFLTGGAFTPAAREFLDRVPNPRVEKPFDGEALRRAVARAVDRVRA